MKKQITHLHYFKTEPFKLIEWGVAPQSILISFRY